MQGALRRDQDDTVRGDNFYRVAPWRALAALSLTAGLRTLQVKYEVADRHGRPHYVPQRGDTNRPGAEIEWSGELGNGLTAHAKYSYLDATYAQAFVSGSPHAIVPAGNRLPSAPHQAFGVLEWISPNSAMNAALEWQ